MYTFVWVLAILCKFILCVYARSLRIQIFVLVFGSRSLDCSFLSLFLVFFFMKSLDVEYLAWNDYTKPKSKEKKNARDGRGKEIGLRKKTNKILERNKGKRRTKLQRKQDERTHFHTERQTTVFTHCYRTPFICKTMPVITTNKATKQ